MLAIRRVLVPVDFSECSCNALQLATALARQCGARITLIHVYELLDRKVPNIRIHIPEYTEREIACVIFKEARGQLMDLLHQSEAKGGPPVQGLLVTGDPAEEIVKQARTGHYDLVVMGTNGRTGLAHLFLGSVTETVLRRAPCPVLSIRGRDMITRLPKEHAA